MAVAQKIGAKHYVECSARTGEGIREVFRDIARVVLSSNEPAKSLEFDNEKKSEGECLVI
jgi:Ras family protein A